jgi:hypothetical protein
VTEWFRSSLCASSQCVEIAFVEGVVWLRNSQDPDGPRLSFSLEEWAAFKNAIKVDEFAAAE